MDNRNRQQLDLLSRANESGTHGVVDGDHVDRVDSLGGKLASSRKEFGDLRGASGRKRSRDGDDDRFTL